MTTTTIEALLPVNPETQKTLGMLTKDLAPGGQKVVAGERWRLPLTVKLVAENVFTVTHIYAPDGFNAAYPEMYFLQTERGFVPCTYRNDGTGQDEESVELGFDGKGGIEVRRVDPVLQLEHVGRAERWLGRGGGSVAPRIQSRSGDERPEDKADTELRARAFVEWQCGDGGVTGDATVECFESAAEGEEGGVILRFSAKSDDQGLLPVAVSHGAGVDLHLGGDVEAEAMLEALRAALEKAKLRRVNATRGTQVQIY